MAVVALNSVTRLLAGRYVVERMLGRGGMAVVYAAHDRRLDRDVAVKVVPAAVTEPAARDRFVREARSAASVCHPNAVAVFDAGEAEGFLYIVMELVHGRSLADVLAEDGPLDVDRATAVAMSLLAALAHAHAVGIVHRDVKPSNIMISSDGFVKLLDFGIARRFDDLVGAVTAVGDVVGTPKYLAPEQVERRPTTPATDLYAVGVVLFEMLAGVPPFDGDSPFAIALAHMRAPVPDVRSIRDDVPDNVASAIERAMAKDPGDRFGEAAAMQAALAPTDTAAIDVAGRGITATTATIDPTQVLPPDGYRGDRGRPWWLVGVAALLLAGLVGWNFAGDVFSFITTSEPSDRRSAQASPTSTARVATTLPATIDGVIALLRANPSAYGPHTSEIVDELVMIKQGDNVHARAVELLAAVRAWVDAGEALPAVLTMLEPLLTPLIEATPVEAEDAGADDGTGNGGPGNGNGNRGNGGGDGGNGGDNGRGNGNGGGNGNGNGRGRGRNG